MLRPLKPLQVPVDGIVASQLMLLIPVLKGLACLHELCKTDGAEPLSRPVPSAGDLTVSLHQGQGAGLLEIKCPFKNPQVPEVPHWYYMPQVRPSHPLRASLLDP